MNNKCIYFSRASVNRKCIYKINTGIYKENDKIVVIKSADNKKANNFLQSIVRREQIANYFFGDKAVVVNGILKDNCIYYPYLPYPTMENLIAMSIRKGNNNFGVSLVEEYLKFIYKFSMNECIPSEFYENLGIRKEINRPFKCLSFGPIDCVPSNILVSDKRWFIIDNEWTYEFPIPVDFLIYRGILTLVVRLQDHIQAHVSNEHPVVHFCGHLRNRTYIPYTWLIFLKSLEVPINKLYYWDFLFNYKVHENYKLGLLKLKEKPKMIYRVTPLSHRKKLIAIDNFKIVNLIRKKFYRRLTEWRKKKYY